MFTTVFATALAFEFAIPSKVLAPQLDFSLVPPPEARKLNNYSYGYTVYVRTVSGKKDGTGAQGRDLNPLMCADELTESCGRQYWGYDRSEKPKENLKVTLLDVEGSPIVAVKVESYIPFIAATGERGQAPAPPIIVRWVPRVAPKVTTRVLAPYTHGGSPLARAASGMFAAAVSTVAAPEVDYDAIPKEPKGPRFYNLYVCPVLVSGDRWAVHECAPGWGGAVFHWLRPQWENYHIQTDQLTRRLGILARNTVNENDVVTKTERVVGMEVKSYGPPPGLRWTFRPEFRRRLGGK